MKGYILRSVQLDGQQHSIKLVMYSRDNIFSKSYIVKCRDYIKNNHLIVFANIFGLRNLGQGKWNKANVSDKLFIDLSILSEQEDMARLVEFTCHSKLNQLLLI